MNQIAFDIIDGEIKFFQPSVIGTIRYYLDHTSIHRTPEEKNLVLRVLLEKIKVFEKRLSERLAIYMSHDVEVDDSYVTDIMLEMQHKVNYFILVCVHQEYRLSTL